jgi:hypothetical protein
MQRCPADAAVDGLKWPRYPLRPLPCPQIGPFVMIHHLTSPVRRWSVALIAAAILAACSATKDFDLANAAITHFRELMAAHEFGRIYSEAADELKKTTPEQNFTRLLSAIDRKLGPVKSVEGNGWSVNYNSSGTSVTLRLKTQFERGTGAETFVYRVTGGKALLASYHINSDDLMMN